MFEIIREVLRYISTHQADYIIAVRNHLQICVSVLAVSLVVGIPFGILSAKRQNVSQGIINVFSALKMIPSLALLMLFIPILGTGFWPAFVALALHGIPTILISAYTGFKNVDPAVLESAQGMGMTAQEILWKVEVPLAMPVVYAGLRTCTVDVIASATLAAYIGAGGLGTFIVAGLNYMDFGIVMAGSLTIAAMSLIADFIFYLLQKIFIRYQIS